MGQAKSKVTKKKLREEDQTNKPSLKLSLSKSASQESSANNSTVSFEHADSSQSPLKKSASRKGKREGVVSEKKLQSLFDRYRDANTDTISVTGVMKFIDELDIPAEDVVLLVIAWHLNAKEMGCFTKEEFTGGLRNLGLDTIDKIRDSLYDFRQELTDENKFNQIYKYAFNFYKDPDKGRNLDIATADSLLGLLLPNNYHVTQFRKFLNVQTETKVVTMDQWMGILEFSRTIDNDFSNLDDDSWPTIIDSYVEWAKSQIEKEGHSRQNTQHEESESNSGDGSKVNDE